MPYTFQLIHKILKPGGKWINFGPLLYHFSDIGREKSIEPPYDVRVDLFFLSQKTFFMLESDRFFGHAFRKLDLSSTLRTRIVSQLIAKTQIQCFSFHTSAFSSRVQRSDWIYGKYIFIFSFVYNSRLLQLGGIAISNYQPLQKYHIGNVILIKRSYFANGKNPLGEDRCQNSHRF